MIAPIGRERECAGLVTFLDDLEAGNGGVLLLEGEGGTGKTTLADWAAAQATDRGFAALSGRSWELSQSVPYEPIVASLGRFLRAQPASERVRLTRGLNSLATLIDGLDLEIAVPQRDASRARLHDAIANLISRIAEDRPVLVLLDDLHWTDESSLEVVQFLCRDFPYVRAGIVATVRPADADERPAVRGLLAPLRRASFGNSITVGNLDRAETLQVLQQRLGGEPPERLAELVWARSIGTPLIVHELIEDLLSRGVLELVNSAWKLHDPDPPIPRAAADLIRDRVDRALPEERELLDVLAIADEPTRFDVLETVTSLERDEIARRLRQLREQRLVADMVGEDGAVRWHLDHPIIAHVIAGELDEHVRRRLHRQLADADPDAPVARRARHIRLGGKPDDPFAAANFLAAAGTDALRHGTSRLAAVNFAAASDLIDEFDSEVTEDLRFRIASGLGSASIQMHQFDEAIEHFERCYRIADASDDHKQLLRTTRALDRAYFQAGRNLQTISDRLDQIEQRIGNDGDRISEVLFQRVLMHGRARDPGFLDSCEAMLEQLQTLELGLRGEEVRQLLRFHLIGAVEPFRDLNEVIDELFAFTANATDWDSRYRCCLRTLELATQMGLPDRLDRAVSQLREAENEAGREPNWRLSFLRGLEQVASGADIEHLGPLDEMGEVLRAHVLRGLIRGLHARYRDGPKAGLQVLDAACTAVVGSGDRYAELRRRIGRLLVAEGGKDEQEVADALCREWHDSIAMDPRQHLDDVGLFDFGLLLGLTLAGSATEVQRISDRHQAESGGRGLPGVAIKLASARTESRATARAALLLEAAAELDECRYYLAAAERRIEAAEVERSSVPDDVLRRAVELAKSCGATWLLGRAQAVERAVAIQAVANDSILTKREWEVAAEVTKGLTNREVAAELFISIRTVTSHLDHIYTKLGLSSRDELSAYVGSQTGVEAANT